MDAAIDVNHNFPLKTRKTFIPSLKKIISGTEPWAIKYAKFLQKPFVSFFVILLTFFYLIASLIGCAKLSVNLRATKLLTDFSPVHEYFQVLDDHMYKFGMIANVYVMNPPDLNNSTQLEAFFQMENQIESSK